MAAGMQPILCVGESFEERRQGIELDFAVGQVNDVTRDLSDEEASKLIVAYEPVWAIGTGMVAHPAVGAGRRQGHPRPYAGPVRGGDGAIRAHSCTADRLTSHNAVQADHTSRMWTGS